LALTTAKSVQPYHPDNLKALVKIHNHAYPANQVGPVFLSRHFDNVIKYGGQIWTIQDGKRLVGYAYVTPIPGLEGVFDLQGCVEPGNRRQGFGRSLLNEILRTLSQNGRFQLSQAVSSLNSPGALFLTSQQFEVEHVEQQMVFENPGSVMAISLPEGYKVAAFDEGTAVRQFRAAYEAAFQGLPWFQPYISDEEVIDDLANAADLLFLRHNEETAGFAWLRMSEPTLGEIEPFGLLPAYQGQGLGIAFLKTAIRELVNRGAEAVQIGGWQTNERALRLYRQIGFKPTTSQTYLAYTYE
jgi:mycothiol synthase